jgi:hypothetical protein
MGALDDVKDFEKAFQEAFKKAYQDIDAGKKSRRLTGHTGIEV